MSNQFLTNYTETTFLEKKKRRFDTVRLMLQTYRIRISLSKLLWAVSIGFASIGVGRGIHSAFGDGACKEADCFTGSAWR